MTLAIVHDPTATFTADAWRSDAFDFWAFDRALDELAARGAPLCIAGADATVVRQIQIRAQRLARTRNAASRAPWFERVLDAHLALHDLARPLVRADLDHALDAWQWTLALDAAAPAAVQLAALLHDVERLGSEAGARVEHRAADYQAFKDAHARAGAELAAGVLEGAGVPPAIAAEACALIAGHERRGGGAAIDAVNDADALSFFSLNSPGYLAYFGPAQARRKVAYTLARMSPAARAWLPVLRVPREIEHHLAHAHLA